VPLGGIRALAWFPVEDDDVVAFGMGDVRMVSRSELTEPSPECRMIHGRKMLVSEEEHLMLDERGVQRVDSVIVEMDQLDATDLRPERRGNPIDHHRGRR
jgi:hypothetical protein